MLITDQKVVNLLSEAGENLEEFQNYIEDEDLEIINNDIDDNALSSGASLFVGNWRKKNNRFKIIGRKNGIAKTVMLSVNAYSSKYSNNWDYGPGEILVIKLGKSTNIFSPFKGGLMNYFERC